MITNLSVAYDPGHRPLVVRWRLDDRYTYLMTSGALMFGVAAVGNCFKPPAINWTNYPLTLQVPGLHLNMNSNEFVV